MSLTPMMEQYLFVKEEYKDCILFFRLGDFYEMFFQDAITASKALDLVLTKKSCGTEEKAPMCGIPYHASENYIARLIEQGFKVAIAEQMSDPAETKGIVERKVIRVITPGTVVSSNMLDEHSNNYLASIYYGKNGAGLSWCDISTGDFNAVNIIGDNFEDKLYAELTKISPKEIITNVEKDEKPEIWDFAKISGNIFISKPSGDIFIDPACKNALNEHFKAQNLRAIGIAKESCENLYFAVGAELSYLIDTQKQDPTHLKALKICDSDSVMSLDKATIKNLELTETLFERQVNGSLLGVLDRTKTAMGSRKMKQWLREPLNTCSQIQARLDAVDSLVGNVLLRNDLKESLKAIYDLERLSGRFALGTANARDLIALKASLAVLPDIKAVLRDSNNKLLCSLEAQIDPLTELCKTISDAIVEDAPFSVKEGGMIKAGFSEELDQLKASTSGAQQYIASLEQKEKERTGIRTLKVGFNKVFGYYIEVSNSFKDSVPPEYIRKQTLVNGERYITPEMKEQEALILSAQSKLNDLEYKIFTKIREEAVAATTKIQETSAAISAVDVLCAFAESSSKLGYNKPEITDGDEIIITKGRHPVIETTINDGSFVSNDVYINKKDASMLLITGPNMAGKSTYMRQLALIVLMAQAGCFVPAETAKIGICDRIYTRIGASDNISMGQSTFFVEMSELAYILNTATSRSLVILDEIGRGTSTYDGLSIAWATVEFLTQQEKKIRTLFATHYHELTELANSRNGVKNLNVDVSEENGNIVFLHKIVEGSASRSYGIHVAKLACVPKDVLQIAEEKLRKLESEKQTPIEEQLDFFSETPTPQDVVIDKNLSERIKKLDLMNLSGSAALALIEEIKENLK